MKKITPKALMIGAAITTSGLMAYSYYRVTRISKGKIVIDMTDNVPNFIKNYFHRRKWLPIEIDLQVLIKAAQGTIEQRKKAQKFLSELGKYISIRLKE